MRLKFIVLGIVLLFAFGSVMAEETNPKADSTKKADTTKTMKSADSSTAAKMQTDSTAKEKKMPEWTTTESGLKWRDIKVGEGSEAAMGTNLNCHYTLWLATPEGYKGKLVQSSKGGDPFQCTLGVRLIKGWSEGMVGMKEGGTRELLIPPAIGYGDKDIGNGMIPANSTLYFEIVYVNEVK